MRDNESETSLTPPSAGLSSILDTLKVLDSIIMKEQKYKDIKMKYVATFTAFTQQLTLAVVMYKYLENFVSSYI
jgi:hypothetical protein